MIDPVEIVSVLDEQKAFDKKKKIMVKYLLLCADEEDWHGVSDAANDLRVLEAKYDR